MTLARSLRPRLVATAIAATAFVWLLEKPAFDSRAAARGADVHETGALPAPGARLVFGATAYCTGDVTKSGALVQRGIAAADDELLPVGSVVRLDGLSPRYNGIYTIMDTGGLVQGRIIDIYMSNCSEAGEFGRRRVSLSVLRLGWSPRKSAPLANGAAVREREKELAETD